MAVSEKQLIKLGGWPLAVNNLSEESALDRTDKGVVVACRVADNVDLDRAGKPKVRAGYTNIRAATICHSLWCAPGWPFGFAVIDGELCAVTEDGVARALVSGMTPWDEVSYAAFSDRVFWSDGQQNGMVTLDGEAQPLGVATPPLPAVSATADGGLAPGRYNVTLTWQRATGEEGGAPEGAEVDVPAGGGILLSGLVPPDDASIVRVNAYVTPMSGDVFYRAASAPVGVGSIAIGEHAKTARLDTLMLEPMPPATILRTFGARLLGVCGTSLRWSPALRPALCHYELDQVGFGGEPTMLEALDQTEGAGVYVAANGRTFWLAGGDPSGWALRLVHPYGAIPGSSLLVPGSAFGFDSAAPVAYWIDSDGFQCVGAAGGTVQRLAGDRFTTGVTERAASVLRERRGERHIVTSMRGKPSSAMAFADAMETTIVRNGNIL